MTGAPASLSPTATPTSSSVAWFDSNYCALSNNSGCLLWGVPWQFLVISATLFVLAVLASWVLKPIFALLGFFLSRYHKKDWKRVIDLYMFGWTVTLLRWGLVWAAYTALQLPSNWTAVLNYIIPIPFILSLFFWTNALGDTVASIGKSELEKTRAGGTKAVGFIEIVRVGKYVGFLIVLFIAIVIFGGNVSGFLNDAKVFGLIIVFAFQPWLRNLVGGMTIFYDEKFVLNDEIGFGGVRGIVTDITLRATKVVRADNSVALIPNGRLLEQPVSNYSQAESEFIVVRVPLDYTTPAGQVSTLLDMVDSALTKLHEQLLSHESKDHAKASLGSGNGKRYSVSLEGEYELVVKTFIENSPGSDPAVQDISSEKLFSETVLCIAEKMQQANVKRRPSYKHAPASSDALGLPTRNFTNGDDIDYTTTTMAFYI